MRAEVRGLFRDMLRAKLAAYAVGMAVMLAVWVVLTLTGLRGRLDTGVISGLLFGSFIAAMAYRRSIQDQPEVPRIYHAMRAGVEGAAIGLIFGLIMLVG